MELVTGRMPTDSRFGASDMDMVRWVESVFETQSASEELIDPVLKPVLLPNEESAMFQVLETALHCTRIAPAERPSSREACDELVRVLNDCRMVYSEKMTSPDQFV